jgi:DNA-binding HxlR family transcriptional regulator
VLASGALRHRDLQATIGSNSNGFVHSKTLGSALRFLRAQQLITRTDVRPRYTVYAITEFGRDVHAALEGMQRVVRAGPPAPPDRCDADLDGR